MNPAAVRRNVFPTLGRNARRFSNPWKTTILLLAFLACAGLAQAAPEFSLLGTNGVEIVSGSAATNGNGTDFGIGAYTSTVTQVFAITNAGDSALVISNYSISGRNPASFSVATLPASVDSGAVSNFAVAYHPSQWAPFTAAIRVDNDSTNNPSFTLNVRGDLNCEPFFTSSQSMDFTYGSPFLLSIGGVDPLDGRLGYSWSGLPSWAFLMATGGHETTVLAGFTNAGFSGDGGLATGARLSNPLDVTANGEGAVFIADTGNGRIRMVDTNRYIWTVAGGGTNWQNGVVATNGLIYPAGVAVGPNKRIYIANSTCVKMLDTNGMLWVVAGHPTNTGFSGDGGPATNALTSWVEDVAVASDGTFYFVERYLGANGRLRKVDTNGIVSTLLFRDDLGSCYSIAVDRDDRLHFATFGSGRSTGAVYRLDATGAVRVAGGNFVFPGYPTWATNGWLVNTYGLGFDRRNEMYIGEPSGGPNGSLYVVSTNGMMDYVFFGSPGYPVRAVWCDPYRDRVLMSLSYTNKVVTRTYHQPGLLFSGTPTNFVGTTNFTITITNACTNITRTFSVTVYPRLTFGNPGVLEGDSGATQLVFTAQLNVLATSDVTFAFSTSNGTAEAGSDCAATNGTVTIPYGTNRATFAVDVYGDMVQEGNETLFLMISNATAAVAATNKVQAWILDDDLPELRINDVTNYEGHVGFSDLTFTVSIQKAVTNSVTFSFTNTDNSATATTMFPPDFLRDYVATGGVLTIPAGQTSMPIVVQLAGDTNVEADETFYIDLSDILGANPLDTRGIGTLRNDDGPKLNINTITNYEGNSGSSNFTFTVTKSYNNGQPTVFWYLTSNGTAEAGTDFTGTTGSVSMSAAQLTTTIVVSVTGDTTPEPNETFYVVITDATGGTFPGTNGMGVIRNDDFQPVSVGDISGIEGHSGTTNLTFTVTISSPPDVAGSFTYSTANGTATLADSDYVSAVGTVNIGIGQTTTTIVTQARGDRKIETDETYVINLGGFVNLAAGDTQGVATIQNDDYWPQISVGATSGYEGNSGTSNFNFRVYLAQAYTGTVQFSFTAVDNTATVGDNDYVPTNGMATIPPGSTQVYVTVHVNGDTKLENSEAFWFQIGDLVEAVPSLTNASGTIQADDGPFISVTPVSIYEGNSGTTNMLIPITLTEPATQAVTFTYYTFPSTAVPGDYQTTNVNATIPAGALSITATVAVAGDTTTENDETFLLAISNLVGAVSTGSGTMTIINDEGNQVFITGTSQYEGNSGTSNFTFVITRTNTSLMTFFSYRTVDGTAKAGSDYTTVMNSVMMNSGVGAATVTVSVAGDVIYEGDEFFYAQLLGLSGTGYWCANTNALMTILDDGDTLYFDITTANFTTTLASASVSGVETSLVGELTWTNTANGGTGTQAVSDPWTIAGIGLVVGANPIVVSGTNGIGVRLADTVTVTRIAAPGYTLAVTSPYGTATPSGTTTNDAGSVITNSVTTPDERGTTQFVCAGWAMSGNEPSAGGGSSFEMTVTNHATLTWLWTTNYYLALNAGVGGTIHGTPGWYPAGGSVIVTAAPNPGFVFGGWSGDTQGDTNNAVMTLTINAPASLTASFAALAEVPPVLGPVSNRIGYISQLMTFDVNAYDDGGPSNNVSLVATGLPASATFNITGNLTNKDGSFSWTPPTNGVWPVLFTANDGLHWTSKLVRIYVTTNGANIVTNEVGEPVPEDEPHWGPEITNSTPEPGSTNVVVDWKAEPGIPYAIILSTNFYYLGTAGTSLWWELDQIITAEVASLSANIPFPMDEDVLYFQVILAIQNDAQKIYGIVRIPLAQGLTMISPPVLMDLSLTGKFGRILSGVLTGADTEPSAQAELAVWTNGPSGGGWRMFWLRNGEGWCEAGSTTASGYSLDAGKGVFVKNLGAPTNVVFVGEVGQWLWRTNSIFENYNLITLSDGQFEDLQTQFTNPAAGTVTGSSDFFDADLIYVMHYDLTWSVFQYVAGTGTAKDGRWMDVTTGETTDDLLLRPGMTYYYLRKSGTGTLNMRF